MGFDPERPTGVALLDGAIAGAIQPGATILALGEPATGMELLAKEFAARSPGTLYYSPDESAEEVLQVIRRFDKDASPRVVDLASDYYQRVLQPRHAGTPGVKVRGLRPPERETPERPAIDVPDFLDEMLREMIQTKPARTVVDTLDFFFELYPASDVVRAVRALRLANHKNGGLLYLAKIKDTTEAGVEGLLEHIADVVFEFHVERTRLANEFHLYVKKVRNNPQRTTNVFYRPTEDGIIRDPRGRV
ncbi:MAG: RAD55 family ATPase [Methanobacteriota archaeon]